MESFPKNTLVNKVRKSLPKIDEEDVFINLDLNRKIEKANEENFMIEEISDGKNVRIVT